MTGIMAKEIMKFNKYFRKKDIMKTSKIQRKGSM